MIFITNERQKPPRRCTDRVQQCQLIVDTLQTLLRGSRLDRETEAWFSRECVRWIVNLVVAEHEAGLIPPVEA